MTADKKYYLPVAMTLARSSALQLHFWDILGSLQCVLLLTYFRQQDN